MIVSGHGSAFTSAEFSDVVKENDRRHVKIAVASPQANGRAGSVNRVLKPILCKLNEGNHQWH